MAISLSIENKSTVALSKENKLGSGTITWDEATQTWAESGGTWDTLVSPLAKESKSSISLSNESK